MAAYHAKKRFGQNFLKNPDSVARLVEAALTLPAGPIVEVGPGRGALTLPLAQAGRAVVAVEFDQDLIGYLTALLRAYPNVTILSADFLSFDPTQHGLSRFSLVGNLPYNITSPVLYWISRHIESIEGALLLMQREVAVRVTAEPGSRAWAPITISTRLHFKPEMICEIPPDHFSPRPAVYSALVRLIPEKRILKSSLDQFESVVRASFGQRRKLLSANLASGLTLSAGIIREVMQAVALPPAVRAEQLTVEQFDLLSQAVAPHLSGRAEKTHND